MLLRDSAEPDNHCILIWSRAALTGMLLVFLPSDGWIGTSFNICRLCNEEWLSTHNRDGQDALQSNFSKAQKPCFSKASHQKQLSVHPRCGLV